MVDLRQFQALCAVGEHGSGAKASRALGWSQPTLDYHLKALESLVGAPLVLRSSRGSTLTEAGTMLADRGATVLATADRAVSDVRDFIHVGRFTLRLGVFPSAATCLLPHIVQRSEQFGFTVEVVLDEVGPLSEQLSQGKLDAALLYDMPDRPLKFGPEVTTLAVHIEQLELATGPTHRLAHTDAVDRDTLLTLGEDTWIIGLAEGDPIDAVTLNTFAQTGTELTGPVRTDDFSVIFGLIAANIGIAVVPAILPASMFAQVSRIPITDPRFRRTVYLAATRNLGVSSASGSVATTQRNAALRQLTHAVQEAVAVTVAR